MAQLQFALVARNLAGEQTARTRLQFFSAPSLIEESGREKTFAVGDANLENVAGLASHVSLTHIDHIGHDCNGLTNRNLGYRGQLAARRITPRKVLQQIAYRLQPEMARKSLRRAITEQRGQRVFGQQHGSILADRLG